eukprot:TRINITY_DN105889_c0_g1_i1.p1 TRINITY_DN105889_c0_g1~~TRINITY_DN105889_c0_g1_i1.p1  ORF type:complete len:124 (+),score=30.54 TRINITY_DN105889_c0_g1_i1:70-441(+)
MADSSEDLEPRCVAVLNAAGDTVCTAKLSPNALVDDLKNVIRSQMKVPSFQLKLLCGESELSSTATLASCFQEGEEWSVTLARSDPEDPQVQQEGAQRSIGGFWRKKKAAKEAAAKAEAAPAS